jgi:predicted DNA-binding transcriptional regulator AlpA
MSTKRLERVFRLKDLPQFVGLRRTQIAEKIRTGQFPAPIKLSDDGRAVAWRESDLVAWQEQRATASRRGAA